MRKNEPFPNVKPNEIKESTKSNDYSDTKHKNQSKDTLEFNNRSWLQRIRRRRERRNQLVVSLLLWVM
jgi:hypothetical protein